MTYSIGHVNAQHDWDSAYGPYVDRPTAEAMLAGIPDIPGVTLEIRPGLTSEHFSEAELCCHGTNCCANRNGVKQALLDGLEALRAIVGVPITVDDAYRCPIHNAAVGGVPNSEHEQGIAADIKIAGMTPAEMYRAALQVPAFSDGGIGVSESESGYVHIDCRPHVARWCYNEQGKQIAWNPSLDISA